jgi:hypothetical protein
MRKSILLRANDPLQAGALSQLARQTTSLELSFDRSVTAPRGANHAAQQKRDSNHHNTELAQHEKQIQSRSSSSNTAFEHPQLPDIFGGIEWQTGKCNPHHPTSIQTAARHQQTPTAKLAE